MQKEKAIKYFLSVCNFLQIFDSENHEIRTRPSNLKNKILETIKKVDDYEKIVHIFNKDGNKIKEGYFDKDLNFHIFDINHDGLCKLADFIKLRDFKERS